MGYPRGLGMDFIVFEECYHGQQIVMRGAVGGASAYETEGMVPRLSIVVDLYALMVGGHNHASLWHWPPGTILSVLQQDQGSTHTLQGSARLIFDTSRHNASISFMRRRSCVVRHMLHLAWETTPWLIQV